MDKNVFTIGKKIGRIDSWSGFSPDVKCYMIKIEKGKGKVSG